MSTPLATSAADDEADVKTGGASKMRILDNAHPTTRWLIVSVVCTWLAAAMLAWVLPSQLVMQPALAHDAAEISTTLGAFALFAAAVGGLELAGLAIIWRAPRLAIGRVLLLIAGLLTTIAGAFLLNGGTLQSPEVQWTLAPAIIGGAVVAIFTAAGLLACAGALFSALPGASIAERMTVPAEINMGVPRREVLLVLTAALVLVWIWTMSTVLRTHSAEPFVVMQLLMPAVAGALAGAWRAGKPNRLATLGLATAAGGVLGWLFLLAIMLGHYYRFDPVGYIFWWGLTGAVFGALGCALWLLGRRLVCLASAGALKGGHSHA
jgi:hypothetical protein